MSLNSILRTGTAVALLFMTAGLAQAQSTGPIAPIGPVQSRQLPIPAARGIDVEPGSPQLRSDTHTLASIETLGVGTVGALTNLFDPSFRFAQSGESSSTAASNSMSSLGMNLAFDRNSTRSRLTGFYRGAKVLYYPNSAANAAYHNVGVAEELHLNRWVFRLREDLLSSPEANPDGTDIGGLVLVGGANILNGLQPAAATGDTILTQPTKRLRSTTSGEINYYLSHRSILTVAGYYASLTFPNGGFVDTHRIAGRAGYDYLLSPRNAIGLIYDHSRTDFTGVSSRLRTDAVQLAFGRRVTGRLAFQMMGGPQQITFGTGTRQLVWTVSDAISYQTRRTQYSLTYAHTSSGGSGVLAGASNHTITAGLRHALTQWWSASTNVGYSLDNALAPASGTTSHFRSWYGSATLERAIGRHLHFSMNYGFQRQNTGAGACPVAGCGSTASRQTAGVTLEWHPFSIAAR